MDLEIPTEISSLFNRLLEDESERRGISPDYYDRLNDLRSKISKESQTSKDKFEVKINKKQKSDLIIFLNITLRDNQLFRPSPGEAAKRELNKRERKLLNVVYKQVSGEDHRGA